MASFAESDKIVHLIFLLLVASWVLPFRPLYVVVENVVDFMILILLWFIGQISFKGLDIVHGF